jgi:patatin-like phospholipase/acyl hydrolase
LWRQAKQEVLDNVPVKLVCGATSAAPTYLPPVQFTLQDTKADPPVTREFNMIDGGVAVNNPVKFSSSFVFHAALFSFRFLLSWFFHIFCVISSNDSFSSLARTIAWI